jgi:hypothetical protein
MHYKTGKITDEMLDAENDDQDFKSKEKGAVMLKTALHSSKELHRAQLKTKIKKMAGMYFLTSVIYSVIIAVRNDYEIKGIGMMNSIFLLFTDLVILSIPDKPVESKSEASWIYVEENQALYLIWVRFVLIFRPTYWLEQQGYVFFFTMVIAAVDTA